jgi:hypothetical protein
MAWGTKAALGLGLAFALGCGAGWYGASRPTARAIAPPASADWIARVGDRYIDADDIVAEMRRRGGERGGLFQDAAARRALLDDLLLQQVLADAARAAGLDQEPETRRVVEQLLIGRYLEGNLRRTQRSLAVGSDEVSRYYAEHADDYAVPARRRVAMLRIDVVRDAPDDAWIAAEARAADAVRRTRALQPAVADFGPLAIEYSSDSSSRYRGGSLGWLTDSRRDSYSFDPALRDLAFALTAPGEFSGVVRGADGVYVARLIELQPARPRPLPELRAGIEQMLLQRRQQDADRKFREDALAAADIEVHEGRLAAIAPLGAPARTEPTPPPAVPGVEDSAP